MNNSLQKVLPTITYQIYDLYDMANSMELKQVLDNNDGLKTYFEKYDFSKDYNLDTIADYFLVKKIIDLKKLYPYATDEYKEKIRLLDYYDSILKKFEEKRIIDFYKKFDFNIPDGYYDLIFVIYADLPTRLNALNEETYIKAFSVSPYLILGYYSAYKKVLLKYKKLYFVLFSDDRINSFMESFDSRFVEIATNIGKDKNFFDAELKNKIINKFVDLADKIIANTDEKKALHYQIMYKSILAFFKAISYPEYEKYQSAKSTVDALTDKWLQEKGQTFSYKIPYKEIKANLDNDKIDPVQKQITLTHYSYNRNIEHFCVPAMTKKQDALFDLVSTPNDSNDHFSLSVIQGISIAHQIYSIVFQIYLGDERHRANYFEVQNGFIDYIFEALGLSFGQIESQLSLLNDKIEKYVKLWKNKDLSLEDKEQAKDCGWKVMQFIETLLRTIFIAIKRERKEFCDKDKLALGVLLDYHDPKNAFKGIFSDQLMQYINYMLTTDKDEKGQTVGLNLRNNVAHNNQSVEDYNIGETLLCIILLTGIVNSLFLHYNRIIIEKEKKEQQRKEKIVEITKKQDESLKRLQVLRDEANELRQKLFEAQTKIMQGIIYPETIKEFANRNIDINQISESDADKVEELKDFLVKYVKEKLEGTEEYKTYQEILAESDKKEYEFCLEFIKYYIEIDQDRKKIFSSEYLRAIDELAQEGLFFYNLRTPDIPETLVLESNKEKRRNNLVELYSLQLKKIYRNIMAKGDHNAKDITEIIEYLDNEQYDECYSKLYSMLKTVVNELKETFKIYEDIENKDTIQFIVNSKKQNLHYYTTAVKNILAYWDNNLSMIDWEDENIKRGKNDCIMLLWMFNNAKELSSIITAANHILRYRITPN